MPLRSAAICSENANADWAFNLMANDTQAGKECLCVI
jgi:hypothetical protein